jgi:uncharacterized membrane protein YkvA (DUF1232 family)
MTGPFGPVRPALWAGLMRNARLCFRLMGDRRVSLFPKMLVAGAVLYVLWPMDLVPDVLLPFVGWLDDAVVLWLALRALVRLSPPHVVAEHMAGRGRWGAEPSR